MPALQWAPPAEWEQEYRRGNRPNYHPLFLERSGESGPILETIDAPHPDARAAEAPDARQRGDRQAAGPALKGGKGATLTGDRAGKPSGT